MVYLPNLSSDVPIALRILITVYVTSQWGGGDRNLYWTPQHRTHTLILAKNVKDGTDDTLPAINYTYSIDTIQHANKIIGNNILIGKMFLLPQGEDGEVICAQVKARADHFDQEQ